MSHLLIIMHFDFIGTNKQKTYPNQKALLYCIDLHILQGQVVLW